MEKTAPGLPEFLDDWTLKDKLRKALSILFGFVVFLLVGGGFVVIGYLGFKVYKNPSTAVSDISRDFKNPSSVSQQLSLSSPPPASPSALLIYATPGQIIKDTESTFSDHKYQNIINLVSKAPQEESLSDTYSDYKNAYGLMNSAFNEKDDYKMKIVMIEVRTFSSGLPGFNEKDMVIPQ